MENYNLEYKRIWNDDYLKTIVAFANTNGGKLLVGVDDNGNKMGVDNQEKLLEDLPNKILNKIGIIAKVFFLAGLIETWGRGTIKITDEFKKMNLKEPEFKTEFAGFSVYMYNSEFGGINNIDEILKYIKNNQGIRANKISEDLGISENIIEKRLRKLKSENKIEFKGSKKTGGYFIKEDVE